MHQFPLLIVPPMINKFYITDLAPGRSMVEYLVGAGPPGVRASPGATPTPGTGDWGLDTYGQAIVDALDAVRSICGAAKASICALCSGGIVVVDGGRAPGRHRRPGRSWPRCASG